MVAPMNSEAQKFTNATFARIFYEIGAMMELKGESPFKVRAYRTASETFANLHEDLKQIWREGRVDSLQGVGKAISDKVDELMTTGQLRFYDKLRTEVPPSLIAVTEIPHVGPKKAMHLYKTLGIEGLDDLQKAIDDGRLLTVPGFGPKTVEMIKEGLDTVRKRSFEKRDLLGVALPIARGIIAEMRARCKTLDKLEVAGSIRRWKSTVGDMDFLATASDVNEVLDCFVSLPIVGTVDGRGANKATVLLNNGLQVDLYVMDPKYYPSLLQHFTGSRAHNITLRDRAIKMGMKLNEYGLHRDDGSDVEIKNETDIYRALGLDWMPPELRENRGEIEAAAKGTLPKLVEQSDIKGDLHCHSTWSDGTESILSMARAAKKRGYEYIAITDHSQSLTIAHGLTVERLRAQRKEIEEAQAAIGDGFRIFHGTELEIKTDGTLDFPDDVLAWLDIVVASIHNGLRQPGEEVTRRALNAVRNPHVDILGHPTGRLINQREPSDMDVEVVIKEAAKTGTAMEVNSSPERLDLDDVYIKMAMDAGCVLSIDTDAHSRGNYDLLEYGVHTARRGWATADRIITTWPLKKLEAWLAGRGK
ncbi:MAG TPA: DNA polymerase/3'-5' exonuclease PolX [Chloroflexia bacterium]|nr:DNA polymerase/3'-5' exonuclease PolX [Chloroflexia bacterium]